MGDFKSYNSSGGFDQYLYYQIGDTITADNGVQGKIIDEYTSYGTGKYHSSLPMYSNTSEVYLKKSDKGKHLVEQARVYSARKVALDFDWGHKHGKHQAGVVHVHEWYLNEKGNWVREANPRCMSNDEIARFGDLFKKANPHVRLRP